MTQYRVNDTAPGSYKSVRALLVIVPNVSFFNEFA